MLEGQKGYLLQIAASAHLVGNLASVFVFLAGDRSGAGVRAAFLFRWAGLAGQLQGAIFGASLACRPPVRVGAGPGELPQCLAFGPDVLIRSLHPTRSQRRAA